MQCVLFWVCELPRCSYCRVVILVILVCYALVKKIIVFECAGICSLNFKLKTRLFIALTAWVACLININFVKQKN